MIEIGEVAVFLGLDVGKGEHHGRGLTPAGKTVFDKRLPNSEPKLRALFDKLSAKYGTVLPWPRSSSQPPSPLAEIAPARAMKMPKPIPAERHDGGYPCVSIAYIEAIPALKIAAVIPSSTTTSS